MVGSGRAGWRIVVLALVLAMWGGGGPVRSPAAVASEEPEDEWRVMLPVVMSSHWMAYGFDLDFPRLALWWPDLGTQSLDDVARYDQVVLHPTDGWAVGPLRERNPDIVVLNATSASEVRYDPDGGTGGMNAAVLAIPPQWFLTQVGSTLAAPVDAAQTVLPVAATSVSDGTASYALFVPGDTVLIEGESVRVETVDPVQGTLTVRRGFVRPAAAHAAGTRIAAHVTFWPNTWMLNVSTLSPHAVIDPAVGPEQWPDYNARVAAQMLGTADWDGILLDRSDGDQSWVIGKSTARTLDPDQSNRLLADYSAFDAGWNAGLRRYETTLRALVGPAPLLIGNWGMPNYDLLNGNNFEGFPDDGDAAYGEIWESAVFGPRADGSYFDWMAQAQRPNLTTIQTYEDDSGVSPWEETEVVNPCYDPGFVPNYRKMRFGLTTALLHDGFFSYEMHTNGHGALCLFWFDEYDNAGAGRDYLGRPVGPAVRALPPLATPNLLGDGTFEQGTGAWDLHAYTDEGYAAGLTVDTATAAEGAASARVDVSQAAGTPWRVALSLAPVEVVSGTEMTLSFWAKADRDRTLGMTVQRNADPWDIHLWLDEVDLSPTWHHYEVTRLAVGSDPAAVFRFHLGATTGPVWLDDVRLQVGARTVWRRDYQHGTVLVNASAAAQTVPLDGAYRKIAGQQAPAVNDGQPVTEVTLPPRDGIILLREVEAP